jgi:hypothetical protein
MNDIRLEHEWWTAQENFNMACSMMRQAEGYLAIAMDNLKQGIVLKLNEQVLGITDSRTLSIIDNADLLANVMRRLDEIEKGVSNG